MDTIIEIAEKIIVPLIVAIFGFLGGMHFEKNIVKQNVKGDNNGNMAGGNIINVPDKKEN